MMYRNIGETVFLGGQTRQDAPIGFYETLGIMEEDKKWPYQPMAEILLDKHPKRSKINKYPIPTSDVIKFEQLAEEYKLLIDSTVQNMLSDAKKSLKLKHLDFKR